MNVRAWVLVLAGGEGRRLQGIARDPRGRALPKQYCDFGTGRSLIQRTLDRALSLVPHDRVVTVVSEAHREWWEHETDALPAENVIVQPGNRGTAAGILLPLLHIAARDPAAVVVVLPSDHHVDDEEILAASMREAIGAASRHPGSVLLLGITPEHPDTEYGWVLPDGSDGSEGSDGSISHPVAAFVEKPVELEAARLLARGALWNSFMFAARAATLIDMFEMRLPNLLSSVRAALRVADPGRLAALYRTQPVRDFSRAVLEQSPDRLRVLVVPSCGWTDLGTPERLARLVPGAMMAATDDRSAA